MMTLLLSCSTQSTSHRCEKLRIWIYRFIKLNWTCGWWIHIQIGLLRKAQPSNKNKSTPTPSAAQMQIQTKTSPFEAFFFKHSCAKALLSHCWRNGRHFSIPFTNGWLHASNLSPIVHLVDICFRKSNKKSVLCSFCLSFFSYIIVRIINSIFNYANLSHLANRFAYIWKWQNQFQFGW